jgi:hypothetical protein
MAGTGGSGILVSEYHNEAGTSFQRQVSQALDTNHRANIDLLGRLELAFARAGRSGMAADADLGKLAGALVRQLEQDVGRHFDLGQRLHGQLPGLRPAHRMFRGGTTAASGTPFATRPHRVVRLKFLSVTANFMPRTSAPDSRREPARLCDAAVAHLRSRRGGRRPRPALTRAVHPLLEHGGLEGGGGSQGRSVRAWHCRHESG